MTEVPTAPACILDILTLVDADLAEVTRADLVEGARVRDMLLDIRLACTWGPAV